jgi:hypothetical protein
MKPLRSSSEKENCLPISSNCIIWQGPDISCINLCKGDSVSDVVYKLATIVCDFQNSVSLDDVDVTCLINNISCGPQSVPPAKTLSAVLQLIIDKVCCNGAGGFDPVFQSFRSFAVEDGFTSSGELILPECLQYTDPNTGLLITTLPISDYAVLLANAYCTLKTLVNTHTSQIENHEGRINALELKPDFQLPTVTPFCSFGTLVANNPVSIVTMLEEIDVEFCRLREILGSNTELNSGIGQQCSYMSSYNALSQNGLMSNIPGWNPVVNNLGQSLQNLWLTVCDLRAAVVDLKGSITVDCSSFVLGFNAYRTTQPNIINVIFNSYSTVPAAFNNCPSLSSIQISDGNGGIYTETFDLKNAANNSNGITLQIQNLNILVPWTITVTGCLEYKGTVCSKTVSKNLEEVNATTTTTTLFPLIPGLNSLVNGRLAIIPAPHLPNENLVVQYSGPDGTLFSKVIDAVDSSTPTNFTACIQCNTTVTITSGQPSSAITYSSLAGYCECLNNVA